MGQNLTALKSRLSKLQSWHQNFSSLVGPNEHYYTRCLLSARTSHGTTFAPRLKADIPEAEGIPESFETSTQQSAPAEDTRKGLVNFIEDALGIEDAKGIEFQRVH